MTKFLGVDVFASDAGVIRSLPRGRIAGLVSNTAAVTGITTTETFGPGGLADISCLLNAGRRYKITIDIEVNMTAGAANDTLVGHIRDGGVSAPVAASSTILCERVVAFGTTSRANRLQATIEVDAVASGAVWPNQLNQGIHRLGISIVRGVGTTSTFQIGSAVLGRESHVIVQDIGGV